MRSDLNPKEILVFRTCGLGDFILSAPAFAMLRKRFPHARVTLLTTHSTEKSTRDKVISYVGKNKGAPWVELLRPHLIDEIVQIDDAFSIRHICATRKVLRSGGYDLVVQMMDVGLPWRRRLKKMIFIFGLLGFVKQVGWRGRGSIEKGRVPAKDPHLGHHVHGPLQFTAELRPPIAYSKTDIQFDIRPSEAGRLWAADWIAINRPPGRRLAIIAPGALQAHKDWPLQKYDALTRKILESYPDVVIAVSGSPADSSKGEALAAIDPRRVQNLCGIASVDQSAALFKQAAVAIGNDGGAMHLADAAGIPVISIVPGLEFPNSIEPWHNGDYAIRLPIDCAPCYSFTCCPQGHQRCMIDIPVQRVFDECVRVL